jgi:VanZ family protein
MFTRFAAFPLAWSFLTLFVCILPGVQFQRDAILGIRTDSIVHIFLHAVLVYLCIIALLKQHDYLLLRSYAVRLSLLYGFTFGFMLELLQLFIGYRQFEFYDLVANLLGEGIGFSAYYLIYKI